MTSNLHDVTVIGGGPAGLAAALWCGRYRRSTLVLDDSTQRNLAVHASHGYLGFDGRHPSELLGAARRDALAYDTVETASWTAVRAEVAEEGFEIAGQDAGRTQTWTSYRLILATGVTDVAPDIPGFARLYGRSVFHCSCCDGYESQGQDVLAIGWGDHAAGFALDLLDWGANVTLVLAGHPFEGDAAAIDAVRRNGIEVVDDAVVELESDADGLSAARLASGRRVTATRAFFSIGHRPRTDLAAMLGCALDELGYVIVDEHGETSVDGVYAVGDVTPGEQLVQTAAAEGAVAGIACAMSLRGVRTRTAAPPPGPDPRAELPD